MVYKLGLDNLPKDKQKRLYSNYLQFEKQYGQTEEMEKVILNKRRAYLHQKIQENPHNYDLWFDLSTLEEQAGDIEQLREVYVRAIQNTPPVMEKRLWKRYIYLWIRYAVMEEI